MAYIENNSIKNQTLQPYEYYVGKPNKPDIDMITIACSLNLEQPATLTFLHSFDEIEYHSFGDEYSFEAGSYSRQVSRKGTYFKIQLQNNDITQKASLYTRTLRNLNDDLNVSLNKDFDSVTVFSEEITAIKNTLEGCITGLDNNTLNVYVTNPSGGSASNVQIFDSVGNTLLSDGSGKLQVSGSFDIGLTNYALEENGNLQSINEKLDIIQGLTFLNNKLLVDSGITGYSTSALQIVSNSKLDDIKTAIDNKHLSSATDSITVNTISGFATSALQTTANTKLDDIKTSIDNKHLSAESDSVGVSGNVFITNSELTITGLVFPSDITVNNFPAVQTINGTVAFSNTSIDVGNFPTTQDVLITNTLPIEVSIGSAGITVNNFPAVQPVSGTIAFSNTSIDVGNFPAVQDVLITNTLPIEVSLGSAGITVNNFPTDITVNNFPAVQQVSGTISVNNFPTGITVNNFPVVQDVLITNTTPIEVFFDGGITVNNFPIGITVNNFPAIQQVAFDGGITVNNFPTGITVNNFPAVQAVSGTVAFSNTSIDSHLYAYHNTTLTELHCSAQGGLYTVPTDESGHHQSITNDGNAQVSLYDNTNAITSTTQSSKHLLDTASRVYSGTTEITTTLVSGKQGLDVYVNNSAVPVSGTIAFSNSSINIGNFPATQPISGAVSVSNFPATQPISGSVNIKATNGDTIATDTNNNLKTAARIWTDIGNATGTDITATRIALDTASSIYVADGTTRTAITATGSSLNTNITNTVPVSGSVAVSGVSGTVAVSDTTAQGYLNTINQAVGYSYIESTPLNNVSISANSQYSTYGTWTRGQYKRTVFNYTDANTANTGYISIYCKNITGSGVMIATFYPYTVASARQYSAILDLSAFNSITVYNGSGSTITGATLTLFST